MSLHLVTVRVQGYRFVLFVIFLWYIVHTHVHHSLTYAWLFGFRTSLCSTLSPCICHPVHIVWYQLLMLVCVLKLHTLFCVVLSPFILRMFVCPSCVYVCFCSSVRLSLLLLSSLFDVLVFLSCALLALSHAIMPLGSHPPHSCARRAISLYICLQLLLYCTVVLSLKKRQCREYAMWHVTNVHARAVSRIHGCTPGIKGVHVHPIKHLTLSSLSPQTFASMYTLIC